MHTSAAPRDFSSDNTVSQNLLDSQVEGPTHRPRTFFAPSQSIPIARYSRNGRPDCGSRGRGGWGPSGPAGAARSLALSTRRGDPQLFDATEAWMQQRDLIDIEREFARVFVSNPNSGEFVKGHAIVAAELCGPGGWPKVDRSVNFRRCRRGRRRS